MKNINIKISRDFMLMAALVVFLFFPSGNVNANLDKKFRENFSEIVRNQYHNSIKYNIDDVTGWKIFKKNKKETWSCTEGKCAEYQKTINCLFDDAFEQSVNQINIEVEDYAKESFTELQKVEIKEKNCEKITLQNIQDEQEINGFKTSCSGKFLSKSYSSCRVTETILNELGAYQNYLLAKAKEGSSKSFLQNFEQDDYELDVLRSMAKTEKFYLNEIKKSQKAVLSTLILYKDFVHNYRAHAWLIAVKNNLKNISEKWLEIQKAIESFPVKFIDSSSLAG